MKSKKVEALIFLFTGLIIISAGLYIYFAAHTIYPNSDSSRVQDLNWLLKKFGRAGTAILILATGIISVYWGIRRLKRK
ncbi:MAG TPA: hypothetical protein PK987_06360 [Ferruginibacter sp.]|mgnify:CR=1 FL=1|nr:hypothetical protein [Ferruginibacter sp.]